MSDIEMGDTTNSNTEDDIPTGDEAPDDVGTPDDVGAPDDIPSMGSSEIEDPKTDIDAGDSDNNPDDANSDDSAAAPSYDIGELYVDGVGNYVMKTKIGITYATIVGNLLNGRKSSDMQGQVIDSDYNIIGYFYVNLQSGDSRISRSSKYISDVDLENAVNSYLASFRRKTGIPQSDSTDLDMLGGDNTVKKSKAEIEEKLPKYANEFADGKIEHDTLFEENGVFWMFSKPTNSSPDMKISGVIRDSGKQQLLSIEIQSKFDSEDTQEKGQVYNCKIPFNGKVTGNLGIVKGLKREDTLSLIEKFANMVNDKVNPANNVAPSDEIQASDDSEIDRNEKRAATSSKEEVSRLSSVEKRKSEFETKADKPEHFDQPSDNNIENARVDDKVANIFASEGKFFHERKYNIKYPIYEKIGRAKNYENYKIYKYSIVSSDMEMDSILVKVQYFREVPDTKYYGCVFLDENGTERPFIKENQLKNELRYDINTGKTYIEKGGDIFVPDEKGVFVKSDMIVTPAATLSNESTNISIMPGGILVSKVHDDSGYTGTRFDDLESAVSYLKKQEGYTDTDTDTDTEEPSHDTGKDDEQSDMVDTNIAIKEHNFFNGFIPDSVHIKSAKIKPIESISGKLLAIVIDNGDIVSGTCDSITSEGEHLIVKIDGKKYYFDLQDNVVYAYVINNKLYTNDSRIFSKFASMKDKQAIDSISDNMTVGKDGVFTALVDGGTEAPLKKLKITFDGSDGKLYSRISDVHDNIILHFDKDGKITSEYKVDIARIYIGGKLPDEAREYINKVIGEFLRVVADTETSVKNNDEPGNEEVDGGAQSYSQDSNGDDSDENIHSRIGSLSSESTSLRVMNYISKLFGDVIPSSIIVDTEHKKILSGAAIGKPLVYKVLKNGAFVRELLKSISINKIFNEDTVVFSTDEYPTSQSIPLKDFSYILEMDGIGYVSDKSNDVVSIIEKAKENRAWLNHLGEIYRNLSVDVKGKYQSSLSKLDGDDMPPVLIKEEKKIYNLYDVSDSTPKLIAAFDQNLRLKSLSEGYSKLYSGQNDESLLSTRVHSIISVFSDASRNHNPDVAVGNNDSSEEILDNPAIFEGGVIRLSNGIYKAKLHTSIETNKTLTIVYNDGKGSVGVDYGSKMENICTFNNLEKIRYNNNTVKSIVKSDNLINVFKNQIESIVEKFLGAIREYNANQSEVEKTPESGMQLLSDTNEDIINAPCSIVLAKNPEKSSSSNFNDNGAKVTKITEKRRIKLTPLDKNLKEFSLEVFTTYIPGDASTLVTIITNNSEKNIYKKNTEISEIVKNMKTNWSNIIKYQKSTDTYFLKTKSGIYIILYTGTENFNVDDLKRDIENMEFEAKKQIKSGTLSDVISKNDIFKNFNEIKDTYVPNVPVENIRSVRYIRGSNALEIIHDSRHDKETFEANKNITIIDNSGNIVKGVLSDINKADTGYMLTIDGKNYHFATLGSIQFAIAKSNNSVITNNENIQKNISENLRLHDLKENFFQIYRDITKKENFGYIVETSTSNDDKFTIDYDISRKSGKVYYKGVDPDLLVIFSYDSNGNIKETYKENIKSTFHRDEIPAEYELEIRQLIMVFLDAIHQMSNAGNVKDNGNDKQEISDSDMERFDKVISELPENLIMDDAPEIIGVFLTGLPGSLRQADLLISNGSGTFSNWEDSSVLFNFDSNGIITSENEQGIKHTFGKKGIPNGYRAQYERLIKSFIEVANEKLKKILDSDIKQNKSVSGENNESDKTEDDNLNGNTYTVEEIKSGQTRLFKYTVDNNGNTLYITASKTIRDKTWEIYTTTKSDKRVTIAIVDSEDEIESTIRGILKHVGTYKVPDKKVLIFYYFDEDVDQIKMLNYASNQRMEEEIYHFIKK